jgi:lysophospholipase L1-like esterase
MYKGTGLCRENKLLRKEVSMKRVRVSIIVNVVLVCLLLSVILYEGYPTRICKRLCRPLLPDPLQYQHRPADFPHLSPLLKNQGRILVCALGDSVTHGATRIEEFDFTTVYHHRLKQLLEQYFPNTVFNIINAGINGDSSSGGLQRLEQDVLHYTPDLVLIEFGLNDCHRGLEGIDAFKANLQGMIDQIRAKTAADIILLTPNFMATSDNPNVAQPHREMHFPEAFSVIQNTGILSAYAAAIREIGTASNVPVADVYANWEILSSVVNTNDLLINGLNHPTPEGHLLMAYALMEVLHPEFQYDFSFLEAYVRK